MDENAHKASTKARVYVTPPEHHDDIRRMVIGLALFFTVLAMLVVGVVIYASDLARLLPFSVEKRFVRPYEAMADYWYDETPSAENQNIQLSLQDLTQELAQSMDLPEEFELQVHYIDTEQINAIATLGGHIFVFRGLLEIMPDENSLAMVLAHEIAHVKHRDSVAGLGRGLALQMFYSFISGDYSAGVDIALKTGEVGILYFSREQEQGADMAALSVLNKRYGHVYGYDTLFQYLSDHQLKEESHRSESVEFERIEWLSSHPQLQQRIDKLTQKAESESWLLKGNAQPLARVMAVLNPVYQERDKPAF
jgi:predicted Zn-dependent protease